MIPNVPYNVDPDRIRLFPGVGRGLQQLHQAGYRLIVVTNQSGVARGYFSEEALGAVEAKLRALLEEFDVPLSGFYYCPHHPDGVVSRYATVCACRKPAPGLLLRAAHDHGIDCRQSWLIGDILNDVAAGRRLGCRTILVNTGGETEWHLSTYRLPHHIVSGVDEAARIILALDEGQETHVCAD